MGMREGAALWSHTRRRWCVTTKNHTSFTVSPPLSNSHGSHIHGTQRQENTSDDTDVHDLGKFLGFFFFPFPSPTRGSEGVVSNAALLHRSSLSVSQKPQNLGLLKGEEMGVIILALSLVPGWGFPAGAAFPHEETVPGSRQGP